MSRFALIPDGIDAFTARAYLARNAKQSIDAQYYFVREDVAGELFKALLLEAAERGVRVRLLVDDLYVAGKEQKLSAIADHPNVSIRSINPFFRRACCRNLQFVTRLGKVTRRMHNKSFTIDNQYTIVGGRNIGDEYFGADTNLVFNDLDMVADGPVVEQVSAAFDQYWNSRLSLPIQSLTRNPYPEAQAAEVRRTILQELEDSEASTYVRALQDSNFVSMLRSGRFEGSEGPAFLVADHPDKLVKKRSVAGRIFSDALFNQFANAEKSVTVVTPYFVPQNRGVEGLSALAAKGIDVRVITNSMASNNSRLVHAHYSKQRKKLLRAGVKLYEVKPVARVDAASSSYSLLSESLISNTLHAKAFIVDRKKVFIGSFNFDPRSLYENTEMGIVAESTEFASQIEAGVNQVLPTQTYQLQLEPGRFGGEKIRWEAIDNGKKTVYYKDPGSGIGSRTLNFFYRLLPIESQL